MANSDIFVPFDSIYIFAAFAPYMYVSPFTWSILQCISSSCCKHQAMLAVAILYRLLGNFSCCSDVCMWLDLLQTN